MSTATTKKESKAKATRKDVTHNGQTIKECLALLPMLCRANSCPGDSRIKPGSDRCIACVQSDRNNGNDKVTEKSAHCTQRAKQCKK